GTPVVTLENGESSATVIDGFTIQNGVNYQMDNGPGITIKYQNTAPTLRNLIIKNNEAWAFGGGIFCYNAGNVKIINCKIENNKAKYFGGGIYTDNTNIQLISSIVRKNSSGGIYTWRSFPKINNSLIYWNNSNEVTIFSDLGFQIKPQILNSTIVSSNKFYAVYIYGRFYAQILNSIIYGPDSTIYLMGDAYDTLEVNHSIVYEYPKKAFFDKVIVKTGKHFFTDDPMFINLNNENFSLDSCSAAIGTADKTIAPPFDVFGHPRPILLSDEENPDIGAVENPKTQRSSFVKITKVSKSKFCKGGSFTLEYSVGGCPFVEGHEFIAELSNLSGTFNPSY
ncbi:MAG: right-handed parallel beta-helix repeat-containing protein, partial [Candidatus Kapaibacteriota bacterium]